MLRILISCGRSDSPKDADVLVQRGALLFRMGHLDRARSDFETALTLLTAVQVTQSGSSANPAEVAAKKRTEESIQVAHVQLAVVLTEIQKKKDRK